jgi:hypothetical protein
MVVSLGVRVMFTHADRIDVTKNLSALLPTLQSIRFPVEVAEASLCLTRITNGSGVDICT